MKVATGKQQAEKPPETPPPGRKPSAVKTLAWTIQTKEKSLAAVATRYLSADRLVKLAQVAVARTPKLAECSALSVVDSLMTCARLGLEPNEPGGVWLVPYKLKSGMVCQAIVDYRGLLDVARRSGEIAAVHADVRCQQDEWEYAIDTTAPVLVRLKHSPAEGERGEPLGAYAVARLRQGECQAVYLSAEQIGAFRARSRGSDSDTSPWHTDEGSMWKKSACRRLVNLLPRTPELQALREQLTREDQIEAERTVIALPEAAKQIDLSGGEEGTQAEPELIGAAVPADGGLSADEIFGRASNEG